MTTHFVCVHCGTLYGENHVQCPRCKSFEARIWRTPVTSPAAMQGLVIKDRRDIIKVKT
jgi:predicted ATP-dependent serine protease